MAQEFTSGWQEITDDAPLYETYHLNSGIERCQSGFFQRIFTVNTSGIGQELSVQAAKRYACAYRTPLPRIEKPSDLPLFEAIAMRQSSQAFGGGTLPLEALATLLQFSGGLTGKSRPGNLPRRAAPSGGGLYPCEIYLLPFDVEGLDAGCHHYDVLEHELAQYRNRPCERVVASACFNEFAVASASAALVVTACFERQSFKYGERAYRFALLEAGHIAQNVLLMVEALGLAALPVGGFVDREINDLLEIDGLSEASLYVILIGNEFNRASG